jgi:hypothetical protein
MKVLIKTIPYHKMTVGEFGMEIPGIELELDADNEVVRVYKMDGVRDPVERMFGIGTSRIER